MIDTSPWHISSWVPYTAGVVTQISLKMSSELKKPFCIISKYAHTYIYVCMYHYYHIMERSFVCDDIAK